MNTLIDTNNKARRSFFMRLLAFLLLLSGSHGAMAAVCTGGGGSYAVTLPATTIVPRDIAVGQPLSGWYMASGTTNYSCTYAMSSSYYSRGISASVLSIASAGGTYVDGTTGVTYNVFSTGVPGVGMAVRFNTIVSTTYCSTNTNLDLAKSGGSPGISAVPPAGTTGMGCSIHDAAVTGAYSGQVGVRLVRIAGAPISGSVTNAVGALTQVCAYAGGPASSYSIPVSYQDSAACTSISLTSTTIQVAACTTPDVLVKLGTHSSTEAGLASIGGTTQAVGFNVKLNNCPAGMNSIQYRIEPATPVVNSAQSVVALDGSSSASGVGVQLLNAAGTAAAPLSTTTFQTFSGYNNATGGSYTIPFQARYFRTGNITPGTANTSMTFTMQYL
jgi:major type 1 subunit fimbrin (pilin)